MKKYLMRYDMADESAVSGGKADYDVKVKSLAEGITQTTLYIKHDDEAKRLNRAKGKYITLEAELSPENGKTSAALSRCLRDTFRNMSADKIRVNPKVLVAGLGNRYVTADALGALVAENLIVAAEKKRTSVAAISVGVFGVTGLESADIVRGVAREIGAGLIIVVDTLATARPQRIFKSFQVTDAGLEPGSASKAGRIKIDYKSVGVPVLAIGVPMCLYARAMVMDTIVKTDVSCAVKTAARYELAERILGTNNLNLLLTPKEIDSGVKACAKVISDAVNMCFTGEVKR